MPGGLDPEPILLTTKISLCLDKPPQTLVVTQVKKKIWQKYSSENKKIKTSK